MYYLKNSTGRVLFASSSKDAVIDRQNAYSWDLGEETYISTGSNTKKTIMRRKTKKRRVRKLVSLSVYKKLPSAAKKAISRAARKTRSRKRR